MSRFSKSEAEARGWQIVHDDPGYTEHLGDGVARVHPPSVRAEKTLDTGHMVNEEAESIGLLLEKIAAFEAHLEGLPVSPILGPPAHVFAQADSEEAAEPGEPSEEAPAPTATEEEQPDATPPENVVEENAVEGGVPETTLEAVGEEHAAAEQVVEEKSQELGAEADTGKGLAGVKSEAAEAVEDSKE